MSIDTLSSVVKRFIDACKTNNDMNVCNELLDNVKIALLDFQLLPPFNPDEMHITKQVLVLARSALEQATLLSVRQGDFVSFARHMEQTKTYYYDYANLMPVSELQWPLIGLKLMWLLVDNQLPDFHVEIELIPIEIRASNDYIRFPIELEQELMEGSYQKLFGSKEVPMKEYSIFMDNLVTTVRDKIASCAEVAYVTMSLGDAADMLLLKSADEASKFAASREWPVDTNGVITFPKSDEANLEIPASKLIEQTLRYACEMERII